MEAREPRDTPTDAPALRGRVAHVSVSPGGVPKIPVESAWVGRDGLEGDAHTFRVGHGGPHRAVCLYTVEAIARVAAEGHPIYPGSCGENLTLRGIELSTLRTGDRLVIGDGLTLEVSTPCSPCDTIEASFRDGRSARISIKTHPLDSRMYARVLVEGTVRPNDPVTVLPPLPGSLAATHALLDRLDGNERSYAIAEWEAAVQGGIDVRYFEDGDYAVAATPDVPDENFNLVLGLRQVPAMLPDALEFFRRHDVIGWVYADDPPWPGAIPERAGAVLAGAPDDVADVPEVPGLRIRPIGRDEVDAWERTVLDGFEMPAASARAWAAAAPALGRHPKLHLLLAEIDGRPVGGAGLFVHHNVGGLGPASVLPAARGRGVHRALIAARARLAPSLGCDMLCSQAAAGGVSERNLVAMGLRRVWERKVYRFDPRS